MVTMEIKLSTMSDEEIACIVSNYLAVYNIMRDSLFPHEKL